MPTGILARQERPLHRAPGIEQLGQEGAQPGLADRLTVVFCAGDPAGVLGNQQNPPLQQRPQLGVEWEAVSRRRPSLPNRVELPLRDRPLAQILEQCRQVSARAS